jgi:uncharacterized protein (TIGR00369 family)
MADHLITSVTEADWGPLRARTVQWHAPGPSAAKGQSMAGADYLAAMMNGKLPPPPIAGLMQFDATTFAPGRVVFTCTPDESMYNATGTIHGGVVCTLLDTVTGCALLSTLPQGRGITSVEIKVNYLKAIHPSSGQLSATGTVVSAGSRLGFTEGVVTNANGDAVATATSTLLILDF